MDGRLPARNAGVGDIPSLGVGARYWGTIPSRPGSEVLSFAFWSEVVIFSAQGYI